MDLTNIQWDNSATRTRRYRPTVRLVSYNGGNTTNAVFSKSAVSLILGHSQCGHIKIGASDTHLVIIPCSVEDMGAKTLEMRPGKSTKRIIAADDIGRKLGVTKDLSFEGEVIMENRDTFRAELQRKVKASKQS